jgi:quinol-cytochrome oxidoreductase complex cytochrome b subunit
MHVGFSVLIGLFLFFYYRMGLTGRKAGDAVSSTQHFAVVSAVTVLLLVLTTFVPGWFMDFLKEAANPTLNPERISFPWYFLFLPETLPLFSATYPFWSLFLLMIILLSLFLLPYMDRNPEKGLLLRPFAMALAAAFLVAGIYFSLVGSANARYGQGMVVPNKGCLRLECAGQGYLLRRIVLTVIRSRVRKEGGKGRI